MGKTINQSEKINIEFFDNTKLYYVSEGGYSCVYRDKERKYAYIFINIDTYQKEILTIKSTNPHIPFLKFIGRKRTLTRVFKVYKSTFYHKTGNKLSKENKQIIKKLNKLTDDSNNYQVFLNNFKKAGFCHDYKSIYSAFRLLYNRVKRIKSNTFKPYIDIVLYENFAEKEDGTLILLDVIC